MTKANVFAIVIALVAVLIAIGAYFFPLAKDLAGAVGSRFPNGLAVGTTATVTQNKITIGNNGTALGDVIATTCTGIVYASLAASTTQPFSCAVTGALTTTKFVGLGTAANASYAAGSIQAGIVIWGGHASSTAGYIEGYVTNLTGAATSSYSQATTSIPVLVVN